ncbi:hypothetical protein L1049_003061 [Liquidambar formosana]|uniref:Glycosyl transferase family 3 domain-containing protein n=1 Tax=Liquidambar formosana TaxID=63359 RepID=A0AAP0R8L1_LIQFO
MATTHRYDAASQGFRRFPAQTTTKEREHLVASTSSTIEREEIMGGCQWRWQRKGMGKREGKEERVRDFMAYVRGKTKRQPKRHRFTDAKTTHQTDHMALVRITGQLALHPMNHMEIRKIETIKLRSRYMGRKKKCVEAVGIGCMMAGRKKSFLSLPCGETTNMFRMRKISDRQEEKYVLHTSGIWGFVLQVIFQVDSLPGTMMLTDCVYWLAIFLFLTTKDYNLNFMTVNMHTLNAIVLIGDAALNCLVLLSGTDAYSMLWHLCINCETKTLPVIKMIVGLARAMIKCCQKVEGIGDAVDIVGTGGDGANTVNISTGASILAAACGAKVAKQGNQSSSSACGSADVLEALGVVIDLEPQGVNTCVEEVGIGFMMSPIYHPAMKIVAPVRRKLKVKTVFNILGPVLNPARVPFAVVGVYREDIVRFCAE